MNKSYDELTTYNPKEEGFDSLVESIDCNHISRCVPPQMYDTDMIIERLKDGFKKLKKVSENLQVENEQMSLAYNSLERTVEIQRKEIEELKAKLQSEKDNSNNNNDNFLMIVMSNIYEKTESAYFDYSAKLRSKGRTMSFSLEEYQAERLRNISKAVKIYKEKANA